MEEGIEMAVEENGWPIIGRMREDDGNEDKEVVVVNED
jgi:hypothetical protein